MCAFDDKVNCRTTYAHTQVQQALRVSYLCQIARRDTDEENTRRVMRNFLYYGGRFTFSY